MKRILKFSGIIILSLFVLLGALSMTVYLFRDRVISAAVKHFNAYLDTPVKVDKIGLDIFHNFPQLTLVLDKVEISESRKITGKPLCRSAKIEVSFGLFDFLNGNYNIRTLNIDEAVLNLARDSSGNINYHIFKTLKKNSGGSNKPVSFSIRSVVLNNVSFSYADFSNSDLVVLNTALLDSKLRYNDNQVNTLVEGIVNSEKIHINGVDYLTGETTKLTSAFSYDLLNDICNFKNSTLGINGYTYLLNGSIGTTGEQKINLTVESSKSEILALTALLPEKYRKYLSEYRSKGDINFQGKITGALNTEMNPLVIFDFSCRDVSLFHPRINETMKNITFTGHFTNGQERNFETSLLSIKNIRGELENRKLIGDLTLSNFNTLNIELDLSAGLNLETLLKLFPVKNIKAGSGTVFLNVKLSGSLKDQDQNHNNSSGSLMLASGDLTLENANLRTWYSESSLTDLNGIFHFNNEDLAIEIFSGNLGSSDFRISGFFKNILPFIFLPDQPILIEADFQSGFLNLNELLKVNFSAGNSSEDSGYHLDILPKLDVKLNCRARNVILKKFSARNVTGSVIIKNQRIIVDDARMNSMGGTLTLSGSVSARHPVDREILADGHLDGINIDSIFYVFNNFNQNFLVKHHLKGQIFADINTFLILNNQLRFKPESLLAFIDISIVNGELNNFEPMQKLSRYIDSEALRHLRFSELRNDIQVKNQVITIPQMDIISNVSTIKVSGTHTFDQHIDYHFMVPLSQFQKDDPDKRFGDIEQTGGGMNIFLKMTGTTDDYKVTYDTRATKNKIVSDFKDEGKELKKIFRKKENKSDKKVELKEDDYFE